MAFNLKVALMKNVFLKHWGNRHETNLFKLLFSKKPKAEQGLVAVEFALIAPMFFYLLFGILEISILLFASSVVDTAIHNAARKIRTGEAQLSGNPLTSFKTELCNSIPTLYDCNDITLDVRTFNSFSNVSIAAVHLNANGDLVYTDASGNEALYVPEFTPGGSSKISVVRAMYSWTFATPLMGNMLGDNGSSKFLSSTVVFRNEPYEE
jgi:Flp pilus assembly protein TadG